RYCRRDADDVPPRSEAPAPLAAVGTPVREPLPHERREAGGAPLEDDELGIVPELHALRGELTVHLRLPEPVAVERLRLLEQSAPVAAVVRRDPRILTADEGAHVAGVAAEVLGPVT